MKNIELPYSRLAMRSGISQDYVLGLCTRERQLDREKARVKFADRHYL